MGGGAPSIDGLALQDALATLPPRMRAAVVLHYYADLMVEGVATALERSPTPCGWPMLIVSALDTNAP